MTAQPPEAWLFTDPLLHNHDTGVGHPESPARLDAVLLRLHRAMLPNVSWHLPTAAVRESLLRVHASEFVDRVDRMRGLWGELDPNVPVSPQSTDAAYLAAGAGLNAVTAVMTGQATRAFALTRPPGHHAEHNLGLGFCMFNNVAVAAAHAREVLGAKRVLLLDWDVHHGNGSQHLFETRNDILVLNIHQSPMNPGTGAVRECGSGAGRGYTVNVPLPGGMGDGDYAGVFDDIVTPITDAYAPNLILVSAGFDAHARDPLGGMTVTARGFARMCASVRDSPIVMPGGGFVCCSRAATTSSASRPALKPAWKCWPVRPSPRAHLPARPVSGSLPMCVNNWPATAAMSRDVGGSEAVYPVDCFGWT